MLHWAIPLTILSYGKLILQGKLLEECYSRKRVLQLVLLLSRHVKETFYRLMPLNITIQVEGQTSQPATFKGFVEALQAAFSKAQLTSPYCKECGGKK